MRHVWIGLLAIVLGIAILGAGALLLVDADHFRPQVQAALGRTLGRGVVIGKLRGAIWSGSLDADDIRIADDPAFGTQPFVTARSLEFGVRLWPLLRHRQLQMTSLTLEQPEVRLLQHRDGGWNVARFAGRGAAGRAPTAAPDGPAFSVAALRIVDGRIELRRAAGDTRVYRQVQLRTGQVGTGAAFPFAMSAAMAGGGTLQLDGSLGPWNAVDAVLTPIDAQLAIRGLDLVGAGLMTRGESVGGVLDVDAHIVADHGVLQSTGRIGARRLQLVAAGSPAPRPLVIGYQTRYRFSDGRGRIEHATLDSGAARLEVEGSFDNAAQTLQLNLHVRGKQQPIDDLQPLLPAFGVVLPKGSRLRGGTATLDLDVRGPLDALVIRGPVAVDRSRLAGYSLGSKLGSALALAGIQAPSDTVIRHAEATLVLSPAGLQADPASADIAGLGSLTGKGRMAADGKLDFRMLVKLDKAVTGTGQDGQGVAGLLGHSKAAGVLGGVLGGSTQQGLGVRITGTASAPRFKLDPTAVAGLLKAGVAGAAGPRAGAARSGAARRPGEKDVLDALLRGALESKKAKPPSGH